MARENKAVKEIKEKIRILQEFIGDIEMTILGDKRRLGEFQAQRDVLAQLLLTLEPPKVKKTEVKV